MNEPTACRVNLRSSPAATNFATPTTARRVRDERLDFWRGLCLIDMVLVHLYYQKVQFGSVLGPIVGSYTRFAAGGFIFISGMSIGMIFLPRALDPARRSATYIALWRRALYILSIQYINALGQLLLAEMEGNGGAYTSVWHVLRNVLFMREGGDLLPFYIIMIALSPLFLELLRRRWGWIVIASLSLAGFLYGLNHPWAFSVAAADKFPPILWQGVFVLGIIFAPIFKKYDALRLRGKLLAAGIAWSIFAVLFVSEYSSDFGLPHLNLHMSFSKVPLSAGEALRYLSMIFGIIVTTDMLWRRFLVASPFAEFVQTLGRKSLAVYVCHLWVVEGVALLASYWWWMGAWQIVLAVASVLLLWFFALLLDLRTAPRRAPQSMAVASGA
jgi:hypothetical protein